MISERDAVIYADAASPARPHAERGQSGVSATTHMEKY
jgi:hypothetical protein